MAGIQTTYNESNDFQLEFQLVKNTRLAQATAKQLPSTHPSLQKSTTSSTLL